MSRLQKVLDESVKTHDLPFVVAMAADGRELRFCGSAGEAAPGHAADQNTLFKLFSMSKAVCATAAMILIDRGKLDVDTAVREILPEFAELRVLDGFDGEVPRLRAPHTEATIRHLASHTAGLAYEPWNANITRYMEIAGHPSIITGTKASLLYPMTAEPGTRWSYGPGVDWLGLVVEAVDGRGIVQFCQDEIFDPLRMPNTAFEVADAGAGRLSGVYIRNGRGGFDAIDIGPPVRPEVYYMGHSLYGTAADYIRFLRMFLNRGELEGSRVLSEQAVDFMLSDHANGLRFARMVSCSPLSGNVDPFPGADLSHSFGFLLTKGDIPGMRSAGSQGWAGLLNSHYWFDVKKNLCAVFMTQSLPFCDPRYMKRFKEFEKAVYSTLSLLAP
jgi:CubicO group peptidase (beta-lactamase class C family)